MLYFNHTGVIQAFEERGRVVHVPPAWCIDHKIGEQLLRYGAVQKFAQVLDYLKEKPTARVGFRREGGMGDIIMLLPVLRAINRAFPRTQLFLFTSGQSVDMLKHTNGAGLQVLLIPQIDATSLDFGINLEGVVERDHGNRPYTNMPRHLIYADALGIKAWMMKQQLDYSIQLGSEDRQFAENHAAKIGKRFVLLQLQGAMDSRTFQLPQTKAVAATAAKMGYAVCVMDAHQPPSLAPTPCYWPGSGLSIRKWLALMELASFSLTMESGPLHMAHVVDRPVVCFYGPTRVQERGAFHPSYGKGWVVPVELNKRINCPSCYMVASRCGWAWKCIRGITPPALAKLTEEAIHKLEANICSHPK